MIAIKDKGVLELQEGKWIELAQGNDLAAFNHLVLATQDAAFTLACWVLKDDMLADDVVQAAFIKAYCNIKQLRGKSFRAWLLKIVRNLCIDELRRRARNRLIPLEPNVGDSASLENSEWFIDRSPLPEEVVIKHDERRKIEQCIQQLPVALREVIILIDIESLNYQEAATVLNIPLGTIKSRLGRARARLRLLLSKGLVGSANFNDCSINAQINKKKGTSVSKPSIYREGALSTG